MALLAARCGNRAFWSKLLPRTSLVLSQRLPERGVAVRSEKFPEYSLIYDFDKVRTVSKFNRFKWRMTALTGVGIPTVYALQNFTGIISPHSVLTLTFFSSALTIFIHTCGYYLFNNVVGYVYLKDDDETVKLSYVGYWGDRVDVDTKLGNIRAFSDDSSRFGSPWYRQIRLNDSKRTYKIYHTAGSILDEKVFSVIFGNVE